MATSGMTTRWLWTLTSAAATGLGAYLAMRYFPEAGFARNPTGHYGPHLFGFAVSVGLPLALAQCLLLGYLLHVDTPARVAVLSLWIPATGVGVMAMLLPLWSWDAFVFTMMPLVVALVMLPGAVLMGLAQNVILYALCEVRIYWAALTVVGVVIGSVGGLVIALALQPMPLEVVWGVLTGAGIGATQAHVLAESLARKSDRQGPDRVGHFSN